jgi:hypothetical protein
LFILLKSIHSNSKIENLAQNFGAKTGSFGNAGIVFLAQNGTFGAETPGTLQFAHRVDLSDSLRFEIQHLLAGHLTHRSLGHKGLTGSALKIFGSV